MCLEGRRPASLALAERTLIQFGEQLADGNIQFFQRETLAVTHRRRDPALSHLHGVLYFGFISRLVWPRGHDSKSVVECEVVIGGVQIGIITMRSDDAGLGCSGSA